MAQADSVLPAGRVFHILILLLSLLCGMPVEIRADEHAAPAHAEEGAAEEAHPAKPEKPKKRSAPSYGKYGSTLRAMCDAMAKDARLVGFSNMLAPLLVTNTQCLACRPFFVTLNGSCRPKKAAKPKKTPKKGSEEEAAAAEGEEEEEGEESDLPTPTPTPAEPKPQRDPHLIVLNAASSVFNEMALDEKNVEETIKAVDILLGALRSAENKTVAEKDYFDTIATYVDAPFQEYRQEKDRERRKAEGLVPPKNEKVRHVESADDLFNR